MCEFQSKCSRFFFSICFQTERKTKLIAFAIIFTDEWIISWKTVQTFTRVVFKNCSYEIFFSLLPSLCNWERHILCNLSLILTFVWVCFLSQKNFKTPRIAPIAATVELAPFNCIDLSIHRSGGNQNLNFCF